MNASLESPSTALSEPRSRRMAWLGVLSAAVATVALSGCWDDSNDTASTAPVPTPAPTPAPAPAPSGENFSGTVPSSAGASPQAFVAYVGTLANDDTIEPLDVSTITTPTPEDNTDEPVAITVAPTPAVAHGGGK